MLLIARRQLMDGLRDAKFLFFATLVLVVFTANGFIYSDWYGKSIQDRKSTRLNSSHCSRSRMPSSA